jgi:hypothetical protein
VKVRPAEEILDKIKEIQTEEWQKKRGSSYSHGAYESLRWVIYKEGNDE